MDKRIIKTKKMIYISLNKCLLEKEIDDISISELCKNARISRKTFYLHYSSIYDVIEEHFKKLDEEIETRIINFKKCIDGNEIVCFQNIIIEETMKKKELICGLSLQKNNLFFKSQYCQRQIDIISKLVMEKFDIKKDQSILYSNFIVTSIWTSLSHWILNGKRLYVDELKKIISQFIMNGCSSLQSKKS
ncbi:MAG: TetR/AcrR family transcriptional regulator [Bacilli bacterium]